MERMLIMDKRNNIEYFIFDLDGTLYDESKNLLESTKKTIKQLQKENKNIIIATGRPYYMNYKLMEDLNIKHPVVAGNGSMIYDPITKKIPFFQAIDKAIAKELINFLEDNKIDFLAYDINGMRGNNFTNPRWFEFMIYQHIKEDNPYRWKYEEGSLKEISDQFNFAKLLIITQNVPQEKIDSLLTIANKFNKFIYTVSSQSGVIDIMPIGISKGKTLVKLAEISNIDLSKAIAFGDADNDISMLQSVKIPVAMGNATNSVKAIAKYIADTNNNDGIAKMIKELGLINE
ncbi:Cof-type HAD-IIB family hydrolase [Mycoplasmopsis caviae]|uniref:Cof-like hydrolase n=1 Tax=Mycoplasmopsis caviae TaxID=55603 RepID=A0A3P8MEN1_9BACT|nr:Cof-type HAD-IIB family hydrolase [Mycoplasmopsis caviae]UUD35188.1 Cof-type HAD-IIB family hydrolase [Mycoplasmopsis caviae]VDR42016.1 Cof-like hydrolase [Mycoplasmopsis caviae]VDR42490.1 Cof-like hydrolase [Mycoplasmopsis caviae]